MPDPSPPGLSPLGELVRRHDPDRFLTALFAPAARREALFTLYAFNHELARAREMAREPTMALIRLQWWREVVEGARRRHEVAGPVGEALDQGQLRAADLEAMIAGREAEAEGIPTLDSWRAYVLATAGGVAVAALGALQTQAPEAAVRALGAAYGAAGILRAGPALARQNRTLMPDDLAGQPDAPERLRQQGLQWLVEGRGARIPRAARPAVLVAALARRDLRYLAPAGPRGLGDRLAVLRAATFG